MSEVKLYLGDCLEVMKSIPDKSVDAVITDPPYSIGTTSNGMKGSWLDNNLILPFFNEWTSNIKRILRDNGEFYINTDWRTYPFLYPIITTSMRITNCIVWDYEWIKAGSHYRFSHEFIIYGQKNEGQKRKFSASERDVWRIAPMNFTRKEKDHQQEKPIKLIVKMVINSTSEGDAILDPFMGSGTTGVACVQTGRNFIGIEIDEKYFKIAEKRIKDAQQQMLLPLELEKE